MARPKAATISISRPFDARPVDGVEIPGVIPAMPHRSFSSTTATATTSKHLEPDEAPTHINMSLNAPPPKRSNSLAKLVSRPSLRLKTSISRLRGRGASQSPDAATLRKRERDDTPEPLPSLQPPLPTSKLQHQSKTTSHPHPHPHPQSHHHIEKETDISANNIITTTTNSNPAPPAFIPDIVDTTAKPVPPARSKRADSGTAIEFDALPVEERPLGFREILAVRSFDERMALYKKTRDYWAQADHGLEEWIWGAGMRRGIVGRV